MDTIRHILAMDKEAVKRVEESAERERRLSDESDERSAAKSRELLSSEREKSGKETAKLRAVLDERLRESEKTRAEECAKLEKIFGDNREKWKKEIFDRITDSAK